jgi:cation transport regulator
VPYDNLSDLPDSVRNNLPKHAQEIYKEAFNSAEDQYGEEERAHRVKRGGEQVREERQGQLGPEERLSFARLRYFQDRRAPLPSAIPGEQ